MDDSFKARVDKIFGSLSCSQASSAAAPWSLTDDEVEKREWNRSKGKVTDLDDETPLSSSFDGLFSKDRKHRGKKSINIRQELEYDLEHLDDEEEEEHERVRGGVSSNESRTRDECDEWDIRASIGLDCTLDNEDEEDEFDKVAEGSENFGNRLYTSDIGGHAFPNPVCYAHRDPRADRFAAEIRLKEDEATTEKVECYNDRPILISAKPCDKASEEVSKLKSALKRKANKEAVKPSKRVKFDPACEDDCAEREQDVLVSFLPKGTKASDDDCLAEGSTRRVPDYLLNPSKYTCYSFDSSSDFNEVCNSQACAEQVNISQPISYADVPKSVTFIPRKKTSEDRVVLESNSGEMQKQKQKQNQNQSRNQKGLPLGIAARDAEEEDEQETSSS